MGRGKIEIKRIENTTNRQVTYSKRRNGIIKKASEITVLCDAKVSLVIITNTGKLHAYHSPTTSVEDILEEYHRISSNRLWDAKHENLSNEIERNKKENDNMHIELRHLKGEDIATLPFTELRQLEDALEHGITSVRDKEMEIYEKLQKNVRRLEEERKELTYVLHCQHKQEVMEGDMGEIEGGVCINPQDRDYRYQIPPFGLSMQPNFHDRM
ncbi:floral homeotic protein PMADS 2-like [Chenopodium quinoa]|uniref:floral homeotic protein PMADS 2-like n=1 Tax=Chenopodium quinoa TaxID=63459 RepID=UPI000B799EE0|nr:floral homeotic protein PMADS 2-like [Chenopodium quinoa]